MGVTPEQNLLSSMQHYYDEIQGQSNSPLNLEYVRGVYDGVRDVLSVMRYEIEYDRYTKRPIAITKEVR